MTTERLPPQLRTERLILRRWADGDLEAFAAMNADPAVMRFFPNLMTPEESAQMVARMEDAFEENNFGLWATELAESSQFMGFVGLSRPQFSAHFTPCVEIGWRLAEIFWGRGYAVEAARAVLRDGFERVGLAEIVSFTSLLNQPSIRVMQKLGMENSPADNFAHPVLHVSHELSHHVLYRLTASACRPTG